MSASYEQLKSYFERVIKDALVDLVRQEDGEFTLDVSYHAASRLNDVLGKHGFEVYGMSVSPSEIRVNFDLGDKYLQIPGIPVRQCSIGFANDGEYTVNITDDLRGKNLWIAFTDSINNFKGFSEEEVARVAKDMMQAHMMYLLAG